MQEKPNIKKRKKVGKNMNFEPELKQEGMKKREYKLKN